MLNRLFRILGPLVGVVAGIGVVATLFGRRWRQRAEARLRIGSIVTQTQLGPVEYAIEGSGEPTLVFHGTPGGYDQAMAVRQLLSGARLTVIGFSRPGYLRTPISTGRTPSQQAAAAAALLDQLGVERVAVIGTSGGGPAAVTFAAEHHDRTRSLVLWAAVTGRKDLGSQDMPHGPMTSDTVAWLLLTAAEVAPGLLLPAELAGDPAALERLRPVLSSTFPLDLRRAGMENDVRQIAVMADLPLEAVLAPTLIVDGTADTNVEAEHARQAAARVPNVELVLVDGATHLSIIVHPDAVAAIEAFLAVGHNALDSGSR